MWQDQVSNLGPLALESDMLLTVLHRPAFTMLADNKLIGLKYTCT